MFAIVFVIFLMGWLFSNAWVQTNRHLKETTKKTTVSNQQSELHIAKRIICSNSFIENNERTALIDDIRTSFPEYDGVSDIGVLNDLHSRFFEGVDKDKLASVLGIAQPNAEICR
jgi:hypothetical protein